MKLGNSNGNNRGKKYFIRGRDDINPEKLYIKEAQDFARWFEQNYRILRRDVRGVGKVDDDAFNETFVRIHDLIFYTGRKIRDYKAFFHRAYYTNYIQQAVSEQRYCNFYDHVEVEDRSGELSGGEAQKMTLAEENDEYFEELEGALKALQDDIMDYVYQNYELRQFEIFKMYMNLKPAINYHALSRMTGLKYHRIQSTVSTIVMDVKTHHEFHRRRQEMV